MGITRNLKRWYGTHVFLLASIFFCSNVIHTRSTHALRSLSSLGRTHFIRGLSGDAHQELVKKQAVRTRSYQNTEGTLRVLFAPDDNLQKEIVDLIKAEQERIKIAIYLFTNKKIAEALADASHRGVAIELIVDGANASARYSKIDFLKNQSGISVCEYHAKPGFNGQADSIMHNKFVIFGCNKDNDSLVWTGSYNFTVRATRKNQENAIISNDREVVEYFEKQFNRLKQRCL